MTETAAPAWRISGGEGPERDDEAVLLRRLRAYNNARTGLPEETLPVRLGYFAHDEGGDLIGGVTGTVRWDWLAVDLLWVAERARGRGLGRRLLTTLEDAARRRGAAAALVETAGFQAPGFYPKLGYEAFAVLDEYPPGWGCSYLKKVPL